MTVPRQEPDSRRSAIANGHTALGIELGSTRIKACLLATDLSPLASGVSRWENRLVDGIWTFSADAVRAGLQECMADLIDGVDREYGVRPHTFGAIGVSAMMHGYLAVGADDRLLVPFRTWRNTTTTRAADELTSIFGCNVPLRWSIAHLYQAILDDEPHLPDVTSLTTLAGFVHRQLTGRRVLGIGDASGMFPIDPQTRDFDRALMDRFHDLDAVRRAGVRLEQVLPEVLVAGDDAGRLTEAGAALLDPTGTLRPGAPLCPPEGDAGTGMIATNAVAPRTGNISAGTSIFAMVVLERPLSGTHRDIDVVTTPAGDPVAMVHCNNGAAELDAWARVFGEFASELGHPADADRVFEILLRSALEGAVDGGGLLAYNLLSGEPVLGLAEGRPLLVRTPDSRLSLRDFARAQVHGVFAAMAIGMRTLAGEGVRVDVLHAHGGLFRTEGVAQRLLAGALAAPIAVGHAASEGGAWGAAVLAAYLTVAAEQDLPTFLRERVFARAMPTVVEPAAADVAGFASYLEQYTAGLAVERAAIETLR